MRHYDVSFFCDGGEGPNCHIHRIGERGALNTSLILSINGSDESWSHKPSITIHIDGEQELISFKNSVLWAFDRFMREYA